MIKELILAGLLAAIFPVFADPLTEPPVDEPAVGENDPTEAGAFLASLDFQRGEIELGDGLATLEVPGQFAFLGPADAQRVLVDAWGNPPGLEPPLGMILPAGVSPLAKESWAVTIEYESSGHVSDEDAADLDYEQMLEEMREDLSTTNQWRRDNGYETVELHGWAAKPHYDVQGKKLHWAKELQFGDAEQHTLNYNIRVLGRQGVLVLNFIASMDQLAEIERNLPDVLAMAEFNAGNRYLDFDPELDTVAAYGLGALIAGKAAAKIGLFPAALLLLKKFWFIPLALGGWLLGWLRRRKAAPATT